MSSKLNMRQRRFAEFYVQCGNAGRAAELAGYAERFAAQNADKLLKNTNIAEYITQLVEKMKDERILAAKDRQVILSDIARDEESEPVDRIRAIDTLNKMTGEYLSKVEVTGSLKAEASKLDALVKQMNGE